MNNLLTLRQKTSVGVKVRRYIQPHTWDLPVWSCIIWPGSKFKLKVKPLNEVERKDNCWYFHVFWAWLIITRFGLNDWINNNSTIDLQLNSDLISLFSDLNYDWLHSDLNDFLYHVSVSMDMSVYHSDMLVSKNLSPWKHLSFPYPRKHVLKWVDFTESISMEMCFSTRSPVMGLHVTVV
jgi:hypothetical protein